MLFLMVIPVLAIVGNGINLKNELEHSTLLTALGVILAPAIFILDRRVTNVEGGILIILYLLLLYIIERKNGIFDPNNDQLQDVKAYSYKDILKILVGIGIVFVSSSAIVDKTVIFSEVFSVPTFYISLLVIALGTNLPELSLAIHGHVSGKKDIAMGDYLGSSAVNTLLFGIFTIFHNGEVLTISNYLVTFFFMAVAVSVFYFFVALKGAISRRDGLLMLALYVVFVVSEVRM